MKKKEELENENEEEQSPEYPDYDDVSVYYPDGDTESIDEDDVAEEEDYEDFESEEYDREDYEDEELLEEKAKNRQKLKKKNAKLTGGQKTLIIVIILLYTLLIGTVSWIIFYRPHTDPSDVPFDVTPVDDDSEIKAPEVENEVLPFEDDNETETETVEKTDDKKEETTKTNKSGYVAKDGVYNILVVGHDDMAYLADVTMIVNIDTVEKTVSVMQIPRDTLVSMDVPTNKINAAFSTFFGQAYRSGSKDYWNECMETYAQMLEKSLCINIHHTVVMNLYGFQKIVDTMGGVDIYVQDDMYYQDPEQDLYIAIPKGWQHLDGYNAEGFVRFRSGYVQADLGRCNAQKIFLTAFFNKVKETVKSLDVKTLTDLATTLNYFVNTDMSVSDIMFYTKFAMSLDLENIHMVTLPGNVSGAYYIMNRKATLAIINEYFNIYNKEITDSIFDRNLLFCMPEYQYISNVYYADEEDSLSQIFDGDSVNDESIYIQFLH